MYLNWYEKGIKHLKDIYNDATNKIHSFDRLKGIYNLPDSDFLKYLTLTQSIPREWKLALKNENINTPDTQTIFSLIIKTQQGNKFIYNLLMEKKPQTEKKAEIKWKNQFSDDNLDWKRIYTTMLKTTKDIKLQNFQYKFLMRVIPTNTFLLKCNIAISALCDFCAMEIETLQHLFWECLYVQQFWTEYSNFLKYHNVEIIFNQKNITFGITANNTEPKTQAKNFMILLGKYFIFKTKCQKTPLTFVHFLSYFKQRLIIEKQIYFMKDQITQFYRKWRILATLLD